MTKKTRPSFHRYGLTIHPRGEPTFDDKGDKAREYIGQVLISVKVIPKAPGNSRAAASEVEENAPALIMF